LFLTLCVQFGSVYCYIVFTFAFLFRIKLSVSVSVSVKMALKRRTQHNILVDILIR